MTDNLNNQFKTLTLQNSSQQSPIEQARDAVAQGRDYIKRKNTDLNSCKHQNYKTSNSLSELRAKLAASDSKRNAVVHIDLAQQKQLKRLSDIILNTIHTERAH
jgi:hypothetical protein